MTFSIIQGDLFDPELNFDALAQGVNTYGLMGAGIAVPFRKKWPDMYEEYKALCAKHGMALGGLVHIWTPEPTETPYLGTDDVELMVLDFGTTIYNMFSQLAPGRNGDYGLLRKAAIMVRQDAESQGFERVGLPWIGCGIAGLEKHNVEHIFKTIWDDSEVDFVLVQQAEIMQP
jgi:O-acetyl-ADP-ribose deacetylase (regulator of RNase III)